MNATMTRPAPHDTDPRALPMQTRAAELSTASFDSSDNTIEVIFTTGATIKRRSWLDGPYDEELVVSANSVRLERLNSGAPFLDVHNQLSLRDIIGSVVPGSARIEAGKGLARIKLSSAPSDADTVAKIKDGVIRNVSVGYMSHVIEKQERDGRPPLWRVTDWEPYEISAVPSPADAGCHVRSAPGGEDDDADRNAPSTMTARAAMALIDRAEFYGQRDLAVRMVKEGRDEATVIAAVQEARRRAGDVAASIGGGPRPGLYQEMNRGYSMPTNTETLDNPQFALRAAEDALFARLTGSAPEGAATRFMPLRLEEYDDALAELRGERRSWLSPRGGSWLSGTRGAGMTTSDFPIALGNAMGRSLRAMMTAAESGASAIVRVGTVRDFRPVTEVSTSSFPALKKILESGEFTYGSINENGETIQIYSFGRALNVSFQVMKNDDLGAIERAIRDYAFAANELKATTILEALAATMSDNKALFHTDHGNLAGSGAAPDVTTLTNARLAMRTQKALDATTPLGLTPKILLVPASLETVAQQLVAGISATTIAEVNPFAQQISVAVEPRLSGNAWYLFADPNVYNAIKFVTLDGYASPAFEQEQEFSRLGVSYRVHWHIGAAPTDFRGAYKNPGAGG